MKLLLVLLSLTTGSVTVDQPPKAPAKAATKTVVDAGTPDALPSAEVKARRATFEKTLRAQVDAGNKTQHANIVITKFLWSVRFNQSSERDGVIVLSTDDGEATGSFFFYREGSWGLLNDTFL